MHRSTKRRRAWDSGKACQWAFSAHWTVRLLASPSKPPYAGEPGHIPLREVDGWTIFKIEFGKPLIRPKGSEFALPIQPPLVFHEARRVPAFPH